MHSYASKTLLSAFVGAATVAAHGHVTNFVIDQNSYQGYDVFTFPYMSNPPAVAGWTESATDNGFVAPNAFQSGDIICHRSATNAKAHAVVAAGDTIMLHWDGWAESHHGPVIDYLANCGDSCETVDKTTLEFFKIDEVGLIDGSSGPGTWGSDELRANNNSWLVTIPGGIAPGFYVLRHEIIALHSAYQADGAQNYPQCINLQITGSGTDRPAGTRGEDLYNANDAGILFNIYRSMSTYPVPGPTLYSGAVKVPSQTQIAITASASAITGSATGVDKPTTTANSMPTTTAYATGSAKPTTTADATGSDKPTTTANSKPTTTAYATGSAKPTTTADATGGDKPTTMATYKAYSSSKSPSQLTTTIATTAANATTTATQATATGGGRQTCFGPRLHARDLTL
jgi:cellulase